MSIECPLTDLVFTSVASERGTAVAVSEASGTEITYADLDARANGIAAALQALGVTRGTPVGIGLGRGISYVASLLGVMKRGGIAMPLDIATPPRRLERVLRTSKVELVLATAANAAGWRSRLESAGSTARILEVDAVAPAAEHAAPVRDPLDTGYLIFTSGSTGVPKGVAGRWAGVTHFVKWEMGEFGLGNDCRVSFLAPPTFDVSLRDIFVPLLSGGTLCIPDADVVANPAGLVDWLSGQGVTLVHCVPTVFRQVLRALESRGADSLPALERMLLAGEPLYLEDIRRWREAMGERIELVNLYGPTETTLAKAFYRIGDLPRTDSGIVPIGRPINDAELLVMRGGSPCGVGQIGEIHIRTPFRSNGYYGQPDLTAEAFIADPADPGSGGAVYRTGDQGRIREDGAVEFLGRLDDQVKVNGIRVELGEVASHLRRMPGIEEAVAGVQQDRDGANRLVAYYTASEPLEAGHVRAHLAEYLTVGMLPVFYVQLDALPVNIRGKVDRKALPKPAELLYEEDTFVAPAGEAEEKLAAIWQDVLGAERISAEQSFFEMGGDSLRAIRAIGRMYRAFGVEVSLRDVYQRGSIRELARWIESERSGKEG